MHWTNFATINLNLLETTIRKEANRRVCSRANEINCPKQNWNKYEMLLFDYTHTHTHSSVKQTKLGMHKFVMNSNEI